MPRQHIVIEASRYPAAGYAMRGSVNVLLKMLLLILVICIYVGLSGRRLGVYCS